MESRREVMATNLIFLALLPGILIIVFIFKKDKVEHEPWSLIMKLVILGAVSCVPAALLETYIGGYGANAGFEQGTIEYSFFEAFCVAALCEEGCKYLLLRIGSWRNKNFDYRFDGIVYGVSVAVGFALLENILYVLQGGFYTALMRGVLAVPLHAFCGVFMGVFYGAAKKYSIIGKHGRAFGAHLCSILIPIFIHGIYDSLTFMATNLATMILLAFVLFMYIIAFKYVNKFSREDWHAGFYVQQLSDLPLDGKNQR